MDWWSVHLYLTKDRRARDAFLAEGSDKLGNVVGSWSDDSVDGFVHIFINPGSEKNMKHEVIQRRVTTSVTPQQQPNIGFPARNPSSEKVPCAICRELWDKDLLNQDMNSEELQLFNSGQGCPYCK